MREQKLPFNQDLYTAAFLLYEKGHVEEAVDAFSLLTFLFPADAKHWFGLAASWQVKKNFPKAIDAWSIAAFLDPENPLPHFHAAECLLSQNEKKEALLALASAEKRKPANDLQEKIDLLKNIWNQKEEVSHG